MASYVTYASITVCVVAVLILMLAFLIYWCISARRQRKVFKMRQQMISQRRAIIPMMIHEDEDYSFQREDCDHTQNPTAPWARNYRPIWVYNTPQDMSMERVCIHPIPTAQHNYYKSRTHVEQRVDKLVAAPPPDYNAVLSGQCKCRVATPFELLNRSFGIVYSYRDTPPPPCYDELVLTHVTVRACGQQPQQATEQQGRGTATARSTNAQHGQGQMSLHASTAPLPPPPYNSNATAPGPNANATTSGRRIGTVRENFVMLQELDMLVTELQRESY